MGIFDNILDDTVEVKIEIFGDLVLLLRETEIQTYEIVRYALKHGILPDEMIYNEYKDEPEQTLEHYFFTQRVKRYIPKVEHWCIDNKSVISNINILKDGAYPEQFDYLEIPDRPTFKLSFPNFLITNWKIILKFYFNLILMITIVGIKIGYKGALLSLEQLFGIYNKRQKIAIAYLIATIPFVIYLGFTIVLTLKSAF